MSTCKPETNNHNGGLWCLGGLALVLILLAAIRTESLWIDELSSAFVATRPDWEGMVRSLESLGSEAQMPLHMAWLWGWVRLFGSSEWVLRASNIPWAVLAVVCWIGLLRRHQDGWRLIPLLGLPILCYYMNEARPYVMTFAAGLLALWGIEARCGLKGGASGTASSAAVLAGVGLCLGASMLNMILLPALVVYVAVRTAGAGTGMRAFILEGRGMLAGLALVTLAMLAYYVLTLEQGHGGQREPFSLVNGAYAAYEILGFGGLGAPRIALREMTPAAVLAQYGLFLAVGMLVWGVVAASMWRGRRALSSDGSCRAAFTGFTVGVLGLVVVAIAFKAGLWGRHFMAVMPLFCWGLASALARISEDRRRSGSWALAGLVALFLLSAARQRVLDEYRKDPLREAVQSLSARSLQEPGVPAVVLAYPLALWYYSTQNMGLIPVAGWPEAKALRWQHDHDVYYILVHRADKVDPSAIWRRDWCGRRVSEVWKAGNARIFRVCRQESGKEVR